MNLVIIRHGDPDYEHDTLTEQGWKEAEILSHRMEKMNIRDFYVSPLGRAQDTASCTLKRMNRTATTFDWLQEFPALVFWMKKQRKNLFWQLILIARSVTAD